jgi:hypothetical protein
MGLTFWILDENAAKLIPAPVELSKSERIVLATTRSLKASYMGVPRSMKSGLSPELWNVASELLKKKGLLTKTGAITVDGKNAIGWTTIDQIV